MRSTTVQALLLGLLALTSRGNAIPGGLVLDDGRVLHSPCVQHPSVTCALTHDFWGRPAQEVGRTYRPLTVLSLAVDRAWGRGRPWAYHLTNVLLHVGATLALFAFLAAFAPRHRAAALAASALFATLAVQSEAVAGIVGRADVMATGLVCAALAVHCRRPRLRCLWVSLLCLLALLCHEVAIVAPALLLICDFSRTAAGRALRDNLATHVAVALVVVGYLVLRVTVMGRLVGPPPDVLNNPAVAADAGGRLLFALASVARSVSVMLVPLNLSAEYGFAAVTVPTTVTVEVLTGGLIVLVLGAGFVLERRRSALLAAGCGTLLLTLLLLSNGPVLMPTAFAERLLYLPTVGLALLAGGLVQASASRRGLALALCMALALGNLVIGLRRNLDWRDPVALFTSSARSQPDSVRAQLNLGLALNQRGDHRQAVAPLSRALKLYPSLDVAAVELAMALDMLGQPRRAGALFEAVRRRSPRDPWALQNHVQYLVRHGQRARARGLVREFLEAAPGDQTALRLMRGLR